MLPDSNSVENALYWYQKKLGANDQEQWERNIEERVLKGFSHAVPKKVARIKTELIDLDLIRGSAFSKAKPQQSCLATTYLGLIRVLLLPFYLHWWTERTNSWICSLILILYLSQATAIHMFLIEDNEEVYNRVPTSEVISPILMFLVLGILQSQIASSSSHSSSHRRRLHRTPAKMESYSSNNSNHSRRRSDLNTRSPINIRKPSEDESGMDSMEVPEGFSSSIKQRRGVSGLPNIDIGQDLDRTSPAPLPNSPIPIISVVEESEEEEAGEAVSSDNSPYSTVNSVSNGEYKRYSDLIAEKAKGQSSRKPRRYSDSGRDKKLLRVEGRSNKVRRRGSNAGQRSSSDSEEGSISPCSPMKGNGSDLDWPLMASDGTSDDDRETPAANRVEPEFFTFPEDHDDASSSLIYLIQEGHGSAKKRSQDKVSCAIWQQEECQKVELSVLDISSAIFRKVVAVKHSNEYFYLGFLFSIVLCFLPAIFRLTEGSHGSFNRYENSSLTATYLSSFSKELFIDTIFTSSLWRVRFVILVGMFSRFILGLIFFFLICVAERTFRERFLYAKYFCHLTSSRRAKRSELPHFRLNKVRNIKTWLSVRSYLKKHGPQRSVDVIVSTSFIVAVGMLTFLCIQLLRESGNYFEKLYCWEMVFLSMAIGIYTMRFIILGSRTNNKYRSNLSILITEQINLYLVMAEKPHKKEALGLANNVLKLAVGLLRQMNAEFKISGFSANPYLYNITKVVVLSAFSALLTEMLGFKLKLHKIKFPN